MKKSNRGFAAMDAARKREIAGQGGRAAHALGCAHKFTTDEAREAGKKGGKAVSADREHMGQIGRLGGIARMYGQLPTEQRQFLSHLACGGTIYHDMGAKVVRLEGHPDGQPRRLLFTSIARLYRLGLVTETANPPASHTRALILLTPRGAEIVRVLRQIDEKKRMDHPTQETSP